MSDEKEALKRDEENSPVSETRTAGTYPEMEQPVSTGAALGGAEDVDVPGRGAPEEGDEEWVAREIGRKSRRSFLVGGVAAAVAYGGWRWLNASSEEGGLLTPLRRSHEFNERLSQAYLSPSRLAPEFARARASEPRVNGGAGMPDGFNPETWRLQVVGLADPTRYPQYRENISYDPAPVTADARQDTSESPENSDPKSAPGSAEVPSEVPSIDMQGPGVLLTLADIRALPRVEMTTELKCIEGWSTIVHWAGVRFADFAEAYRPATRDGSAPDVRNRPQSLARYASLATPDGGYYVGMDLPSLLHPQTLLCYEMNGQPLSIEHGAPLRLVTPLKYGIKYIKRVGRVTFTDERPADFWAERGYDWYSGH
jgi:hypothetical protein